MKLKRCVTFSVLILSYLLLGGSAGLLAGLLGVGGGMIIVPALLLAFTHYLELPEDLSMRLAIGTSLASIMLTAMFSVYAHHQRKAVLWPLFRAFTPGIIIGALILGPMTAQYLAGNVLHHIFALFCLLMALQMLVTLKREGPAMVKRGNFFGPALLIGALSSILGIAGSSMAALVLHWYRYSMRTIVGTSAAIGVPVAVCGTLGLIVTGWQVPGLPNWSSGYVYWPAFGGIVLGSACTTPLGAYLAHKLPIQLLKRLFAILLVMISTQLFLSR